MTLTATMSSSDRTEPADLALPGEAQDLLFRSARTANTFTDEPVTPEQFVAVHDLIKWGPTAMNSQPLRVVLVAHRGRVVTGWCR